MSDFRRLHAKKAHMNARAKGRVRADKVFSDIMTAENPIYDLLIDTLRTRKVSDFHIHADQPIHVRESGEIIPLNFIATNELLEDLLRRELGDEGFEAFDESGDVDFAIQFRGQRFRANGYKMLQGYAMVLRVIVTEVPHIDALGLPPAVHQVLTQKSGLVLVTGVAGSGKSTTLAILLERLVQCRGCRVITIEEPIEFLHPLIPGVHLHHERWL